MNDAQDVRTIIEKAKTGDNEAIGKLYETNRTKGLYIARQYVGNQDDAEDMYQDAFLKAMTNLDKFDPSKDFGPWLDTIIANTCKNFLIKKKAVNFSDLSDEDNDLVDRIDDKDSENLPELSYDRKEFMGIMDGIINELPQAQKEAVILFYYREMSVKDIAGIQDAPEDTIKSRLNYSRKKVGTAVEEYEKKTGVKLHGILPLPVLLFLFYKDSAYAAEAESFLSLSGSASGGMKGSVQETAGKATGKAVKETAERTAKDAVIGSARKALLGTVIRIAIPVAAVVVIGTGIIFSNNTQKHKTPSKPKAEVHQTASPEKKEVTPTPKATSTPRPIKTPEPKPTPTEFNVESLLKFRGPGRIHTLSDADASNKLRDMFIDLNHFVLDDPNNEFDPYDHMTFGFCGQLRSVQGNRMVFDHVYVFICKKDYMTMPADILEEYGMPVSEWKMYGTDIADEGVMQYYYMYHYLGDEPFGVNNIYDNPIFVYETGATNRVPYYLKEIDTIGLDNIELDEDDPIFFVYYKGRDISKIEEGRAVFE